MSLIFSAIMTTAAFRLPLVISGMMDASTTLRPVAPLTWPR
ncbi:uncharacterized protein METZ01_LOCUS255643 [marine metagenome]|uniref:Uncharacterized protein n=1 Tax=marine metagenome TaxID=408172 RepID=A0A382IU24_9ZZZZ